MKIVGFEVDVWGGVVDIVREFSFNSEKCWLGIEVHLEI
jgi:hypothetical protein